MGVQEAFNDVPKSELCHAYANGADLMETMLGVICPR
jgi:hypothetical protein